MNEAVRKWLVGLLIVAGVSIMAYPAVVNNIITPYKLGKEYKNTMSEVSADDIKSNLEERDEDEDVFDFDDVKSLETVIANPVINKKDVIGGIHIPIAGVNLPIMYGATNANMNVASGTMKKSQEMGKGNYALAGHNARNKDILFAPLRRVEIGDMMYITDKDKVYGYKTIRSEVVLPHRVDVIDDVPGEELLTLVSCYSDDGHDRIVITGELTSVGDYRDSGDEIIKAFNDM